MCIAPASVGKTVRARCAAVSLALLLLSGCDEVSTEGLMAQVLQQRGNVSVLHERDRRGAQVGEWLRVGSTVQSADASSATVSLVPGMVLELNADTQVKIDKLREVKSGNAAAFAMRSRTAEIELQRGSMQVVMPVSFAESRIDISTSAGLLSAPETNIFYVGCSSDHVRVTAARGSIAFRRRSGDAAQVLEPGSYVDISLTTGTFAAAPERLESNATAMEQAKQALEAEQKAISLMAQHRNIPP